MVIRCAALVLVVSLALAAGPARGTPAAHDEEPLRSVRGEPTPAEAWDPATPRGAWERFRKAVSENDGEGIWSFLSLASRQALISDSDGSMERLRQTPDAALQGMADAAGVSPAALKAAPAGDLAPLVMKAEAVKNRTRILSSAWKSVTVTGDTAVMTVTLPGGADERSVLVREAGTWRLDGPATTRARQK
jgi:hypothetical protein